MRSPWVTTFNFATALNVLQKRQMDQTTDTHGCVEFKFLTFLKFNGNRNFSKV